MSNETQSPARQRIEALLDANSFVEIGAKVTARNTDFNLSGKRAPSDGVITGYGIIDGSLVYVYSQDASVLNGTMGEMHAGKIVRLYEMAQKTGAPVIGLVDCAGLRLEEASDALEGFGKIYRAQADASGVIPQILGIFGNCGGGMATVAALADFVYMEEKNGRMYVNSPNALKGNIDSSCDTSLPAYQSEKTGLVDGTGSPEEVLASIRKLVSILPANNEDDMSYEECTDSLNRACPDLQACASDPVLMLQRIGDSQFCVEAKPAYAPDMVTAFIRLNGTTVGVAANRTVRFDEEGREAETFEAVLSARGAKKAAAFVEFCDAFSIPVITLTNVRGYKASKCSEANMAKAVARLTYAFANATTPKINVITGEAFGSAYLTMNSKAVGADLVYAWTDAKIGMMDAAQAAKILYDGAGGEVIREKTAEYDALQNGVESAAARGYVDTIIAPEDTRKYLIGAVELLFTKRESRPDRKHGTV
jgi:acetyl-CoA carboxylase carboxyltransferase component